MEIKSSIVIVFSKETPPKIFFPKYKVVFFTIYVIIWVYYIIKYEVREWNVTVKYF